MGEVGKISPDNLKTDSHWRIAIIQALFNEDITGRLVKSSVSKLKKLGLIDEQVSIYQVPGALEVPLAAQWALEGKFDGVIIIGAVIRGETTHYEYVCNGVERGCTLIQMKTNKPIAQAVLTVESREQALDRCGGSHGDKGAEAAEVVVSMLNLKNKLTH